MDSDRPGKGKEASGMVSITDKGQETLRDPSHRYALGPAGILAGRVGCQGS